MAPPRAACDPAAVPGCTHSCSAESALFQGLILNLCFSHPPQALSSFGLVLVPPPPPQLSPIICFALQAAKLFHFCQHLPVCSSRRRDSLCLSSSLTASYFTANQTTRPLQSPAFLICPCCSVGNESHRTRLCCNQLAEGARTERAFTGWLNLLQCLP